MKKLICTAAALAISFAATASHAAVEGKVIGASGDANYPVQVQGSDGAIYNCRKELFQANGTRVRRCVSNSSGSAMEAGGLGAGGAVGLAVILLAVAGAASGGSSSSTSTN